MTTPHREERHQGRYSLDHTPVGISWVLAGADRARDGAREHRPATRTCPLFGTVQPPLSTGEAASTGMPRRTTTIGPLRAACVRLLISWRATQWHRRKHPAAASLKVLRSRAPHRRTAGTARPSAGRASSPPKTTLAWLCGGR